MNKSDEQREREMIAEQIERAAALQEEAKGDSTGSSDSPSPPAELIRNEGEKVKLSFSLKKPSVFAPDATNTLATSSGAPIDTAQTDTSESKPEASTSSSVEGTSTYLPPVTFKASAPAPTNVFKTNVFKTAAKPAVSNVFKSSSNPTTKYSLAGSAASASTKRPLSMTEALMQEDMERKRRRMDREASRV